MADPDFSRAPVRLLVVGFGTLNCWGAIFEASQAKTWLKYANTSNHSKECSLEKTAEAFFALSLALRQINIVSGTDQARLRKLHKQNIIFTSLNLSVTGAQSIMIVK